MLPEAKKNLLYGRLSRRLRTLGLSSFEEYRQYLKENSAEELQLFINALSTNHTKFFREQHHFEHFVTDVVAPFLAKPSDRRTAAHLVGRLLVAAKSRIRSR